MDHRDRAAPVALARHAPVAQPPVHLAAADAAPLQFGDHRAFGGLHVQSVQEARVEDRARADIGFVADREAGGSAPGGSTTGLTCRPYLRAKSRSRWSCAGQPKIGAGAVFHQHEIGDPDREVGSVQERVTDAQPGIVALLLGGLDHRLAGAHAAALGDERGGVRIACGDRRGQRMSGASARNDMPNSVSGRVV